MGIDDRGYNSHFPEAVKFATKYDGNRNPKTLAAAAKRFVLCLAAEGDHPEARYQLELLVRSAAKHHADFRLLAWLDDWCKELPGVLADLKTIVSNRSSINQPRAPERVATMSPPIQQHEPELEQPHLKPGEVGRLLIARDLYISVHSDGCPAGFVAEGALGYVVKCSAGEQGDVALKVPKLVADTVSENANIDSLMDAEVKTCRTLQVSSVNMQSLLTASANSPLRMAVPRPVPSLGSLSDQAGQYIILSFGKSGGPRFCGVRVLRGKAGETLTFYPSRPPELAALDVADFKRALDDSRGTRRTELSNSVRIATRLTATDGELDIGPLDSRTREKPAAWYLGLNSVAYLWADSRLDELISKGTLRDEEGWDPSQEVRLIERMLEGLFGLHSMGLIHGDLRPANVMRRGKAKQAADSFFLTDYGAFATSTPVGTAEPNGPNATVVGGVAGGFRASPFYAPERVCHFESEDGDCAIVYYDRNKNPTVVIGWKTDLTTTDEKTNETRPKEPTAPTRPPKSTTSTDLRRGDRIRLQDLVFQIQDCWTESGRTVAVCERVVWQIEHEKVLSIVDRDQVMIGRSVRILSLSRLVRILQWSEATDLYSIGVMLACFLYENADPAEEPEASFDEMLDVLSSPAYARSVWSLLDTTCGELEQLYAESRASLSPEALPSLRRSESEGQVMWEAATLRGEEDPSRSHDRLAGHLVVQAGRLTQTGPGLRKVLRRLGGSLPMFLYVVRFILACLHRQDSLMLRGEVGLLPFAKSRVTKSQGKAAEAALAQLQVVQDVVSGDRGGFFSKLCCKVEALPTYQPASDAYLRLLTTELSDKLKEIEELAKTPLDGKIFGLLVKGNASELLGRIASVAQGAAKLNSEDHSGPVG